MPSKEKEKCVCQICICGEHRCHREHGCPSSSKEKNSHVDDVKDGGARTRAGAGARTGPQDGFIPGPGPVHRKPVTDEVQPKTEKRERSRKQWETSPEHIQKICRSFSNFDVHGIDSQERAEGKGETGNEITLPPIAIKSGSEKEKDPKVLPIVGESKVRAEPKSYPGQSEIMEHIVESILGAAEGGRNQIEVKKAPKEEWVVTKTLRLKPRDHLKLEGKMDMETTYSSYDTSARKIETQRKLYTDSLLPDNKAIVVGPQAGREDGTKTAPKQKPVLNGAELPSNPYPDFHKRKNRPKTSLRLTGEADFTTSNENAFKNFVVIDGKKEEKSAKSRKSGKHRSGSERRAQPKERRDNSGSKQPIKLPKVSTPDSNGSRKNSTELSSNGKQIIIKETVVNVMNGVNGASGVSGVNGAIGSNPKNGSYSKSNKAQHENALKASHEMTMEKGKSLANNGFFTEKPEAKPVEKVEEDGLVSNNNSKVGKRDLEPINGEEKYRRGSKDSLGHEKGFGVSTAAVFGDNREHVRVMSSADQMNYDLDFQSNRKEREMGRKRNESSQQTADCCVNPREARITARYAPKSGKNRYHSLPRTRVRKHKNEDHFRFVGKMDFATTTKSTFKDITSTIAQDVRDHNLVPAKNRKKRDLFRTSTEVELFNGRQFDGSTTYSSQFKDRFYCPVIDLDTNRSEYKFKAESGGGHKFYLKIQ